MVNPDILQSSEILLVGMSKQLQLSDENTVELWKLFVPRRNEIQNRTDENLYSVHIYDEDFKPEGITPQTMVTRYASARVNMFNEIPDGMESLTIPSGLWAVFTFKGTPQQFPETWMQFMFEWLPSSPYQLDARPHFEVLGKNYKHNDHDSEEEVWIPIIK